MWWRLLFYNGNLKLDAQAKDFHKAGGAVRVVGKPIICPKIVLRMGTKANKASNKTK